MSEMADYNMETAFEDFPCPDCGGEGGCLEGCPSGDGEENAEESP